MSQPVLGLVPGQHSDLPNIALTIINHSPIALGFDRAAGLALPSITPFSAWPQRIASTYHVNDIPIELGEVVFGVPLLEQVLIPFSQWLADR
jgi:hypothetical protein